MKKKLFVILFVLIALLVTTTVVLADKPTGFDAQGNETKWENTSCTKIQSGVLYGSDGLLTTGFNEWGYNYQGHVFNGAYCDYHPIYRPGGTYHDWCVTNYGNVELLMKWNDSWLSNVDCDGDGSLDRHHGYPSYIGSGSWTTNHMWGSYEYDGQTCNWDFFVKIVAAPEGAYVDEPYDEFGNGTYYNVDGTMIGAQIWGSFATIQEVENDHCAGINGLQFGSPDHSGLGGW